MATAQQDIDHYLEAARELALRVAAASDSIDSEREIPSDLAADMADKGFFRLLLPRSLGGAELNFLDFLRIVEIFAEADSSTAWCICQNNILTTYSVRMPEETAREIWSNRRAVVTNGPPASPPRAVAVDGGYRLSGRWNFSSGVRHATWVAAIAPITRSEDGRDAPAGPKENRILLIPKEEVRLIDVWQVKGLRGTGSFGFEIDDRFIPNARTYTLSDPVRENGTLYVIPTVVRFGAGFGTAALGAARAALDSAIELAGSRMPAAGGVLLRDMSTTQRQIGQAEAVWRSAKAFLRESITAVWESAGENHSLTIDERVQLRLAATHATRMSADVVDIAYNLLGSTAIFDSHPIQRRFQDVHVMTQQGQGRMSHYDDVGKFYLGIEVEGLF